MGKIITPKDLTQVTSNNQRVPRYVVSYEHFLPTGFDSSKLTAAEAERAMIEAIRLGNRLGGRKYKRGSGQFLAFATEDVNKLTAALNASLYAWGCVDQEIDTFDSLASLAGDIDIGF